MNTESGSTTTVTNLWITGPAITVTMQTPSGERVGLFVSDPDTKALLEDARRKLENAEAQIRSLEDKLKRYVNPQV